MALRKTLLAQGPAALELHLSSFEAAIRDFQKVQNEIRISDLVVQSEWRAELRSLQAELRRVAWLIEHGSALWKGWARQLGSAGGYTSSGEAAPVVPAKQVSIRG